VRISNHEPTYRLLNVCVDGMTVGRNCSRCWKCSRVIMMLDIIGKLDRYAAVFDTETFRQNRDALMLCLRAEPESTAVRDVVEMASQVGYDLRASLKGRVWRTAGAVL